MNEPLIKGVPMPTDPDSFQRVNNALNNILKRGKTELTGSQVEMELNRSLATIAELNTRKKGVTGVEGTRLEEQRQKAIKRAQGYIGDGDEVKTIADSLNIVDGEVKGKSGAAHGLKHMDKYTRAATLGEKAGAAGRVATQWLFGGNAKQIGARSGLVLGGIYGANKVMDWLR